VLRGDRVPGPLLHRIQVVIRRVLCRSRTVAYAPHLTRRAYRPGSALVPGLTGFVTTSTGSVDLQTTTIVPNIELPPVVAGAPGGHPNSAATKDDDG